MNGSNLVYLQATMTLEFENDYIVPNTRKKGEQM